MPFEISWNDSCARVRFRDQLGPDDIRAYLETYYSDPRASTVKARIFDLTEVSDHSISAADVPVFSEFEARKAHASRPEKIAVVTLDPELAERAVEHFEILGETHEDWEVRLFTEESEAHNWAAR